VSEFRKGSDRPGELSPEGIAPDVAEPSARPNRWGQREGAPEMTNSRPPPGRPSSLPPPGRNSSRPPGWSSPLPPPGRISSRPPPGRGAARQTAGHSVDFGLMTPAMRVVDELLSVEIGERMLLVHDEANAEVALAFEFAAAERGARVERMTWAPVAQRPLASCPDALLAAIPGAAATVLAVTFEEGEYNARHALASAAGLARTRHVHMIGTGRKAFIGSMMASTGRVFDLLQSLRGAMRPNSRLSVRSAAGTSLEIEMAPHLRWFANGQLVRPGHFVNVPFGALISSPANVNGIYVVDAALGGGMGARVGSLEGRSIRLALEGGRVKHVDCRDMRIKRYVESFVAEGQGHERIGQVNLGANIGILSPLGEIVHDENMPGVHLSLGEPFAMKTGANWTSHGQLAFASVSSDVDLDDEPLIRRGRYVRFV
jgi:aminopeptidase